MKLFLIRQPQHGHHSWYISEAVVVADDEDHARRTYPSYGGEGFVWSDENHGWFYTQNRGPWYGTEWCHPAKIEVEYLGEAKEDSKAGTVCYRWERGWGDSNS